MQIRKLTHKDRGQLFELIDTIERTIECKEWWQSIDSLSIAHFFDEEWTEFYGMFFKGKLIGAAALFYNTHEYKESLKQLDVGLGKVAQIGRAMVLPEARGKNIFYRIAEELIKAAGKRDIDYIITAIHPNDIRSRYAFRKLGMQRQCTYTKNGIFKMDVYLKKI